MVACHGRPRSAGSWRQLAWQSQQLLTMTHGHSTAASPARRLQLLRDNTVAYLDEEHTSLYAALRAVGKALTRPRYNYGSLTKEASEVATVAAGSLSNTPEFGNIFLHVRLLALVLGMGDGAQLIDSHSFLLVEGFSTEIVTDQEL